jgi:hypothetical protein
MVAIVIFFPGIVTDHVSKAGSAIKGTGADEIRRQLEAPAAPQTPADSEPARPQKDEDPAAAIERMLKDQK